MKKNIIGAVMFGLLVMNAGADIIVGTTTTGGNRQQDAVGVKFELNSSLAAFSATDYTLNSFTFRQGSPADSTALWLDIYQAPTAAAVGGLVWTPGSEDTTGLTYLGSSSSSADWSSTSNGDVTYTFSGITLTADRDIYVAISSDNSAGNFVQAGHHSVNGAWNADSDFNNLNLADYAELEDSDTGDGIIFSADVTVVPEPATMGMVAMAGALLLLMRRRMVK